MSKIKLFLTTLLLGTATFVSMTFLPGPALAGGNYTVVSGDCLWSIANKFGISVNALKTANALSSDLLRPGQILAIPNNIPQLANRGSVDRSLPTTGQITRGELVAWQDVHPWFKNGTTAVLKDVATGKQLQIYRLFGTNHADCEPLTAQDTKTMKELYGGEWSWNRRAVILLYNEQAIAASMAGMPHGSCNIKNNGFNGHFDLHFLNSRTHATNKVDPDHQRMVNKAAGGKV